MARLFSVKPSFTMKGRQFKGLRGWAGKPLHPPLTDVPVTAYILAAVFDLVSGISGEGSRVATDFFRAGTYVIIAGAAVSLATAATGFADWLTSTSKHTQAWRTANAHMATMLVVTVLVILDIALRLSAWDAGYPGAVVVGLSVLVAVLVLIGATLGGSLVYDYGFNVETSGDHPVWHRNEEDVFPGPK